MIYLTFKKNEKNDQGLPVYGQKIIAAPSDRTMQINVKYEEDIKMF